MNSFKMQTISRNRDPGYLYIGKEFDSLMRGSIKSEVLKTCDAHKKIELRIKQDGPKCVKATNKWKFVKSLQNELLTSDNILSRYNIQKD